MLQRERERDAFIILRAHLRERERERKRERERVYEKEKPNPPRSHQRMPGTEVMNFEAFFPFVDLFFSPNRCSAILGDFTPIKLILLGGQYCMQAFHHCNIHEK